MYTGSYLNFAVVVFFFFEIFTLFLLAYLRPLHVGFAIRRLERPREVTGTLPRFLHLTEE